MVGCWSDQSRMERSSEAEAQTLPLHETDKSLMLSVCPLQEAKRKPERKAQILTSASSDPVTRKVWVGSRASEKTALRWPRMVFKWARFV